MTTIASTIANAYDVERRKFASAREASGVPRDSEDFFKPFVFAARLRLVNNTFALVLIEDITEDIITVRFKLESSESFATVSEILNCDNILSWSMKKE